ncbi:rod shape-determining protein [Streptomyces sp. NPDC006134]|uniref:rod shape-determining protein n=1 Tax=Streptomyces sp. NPDC006134 TaxID=3154467 RepID=UPI0033E7E981
MTAAPRVRAASGRHRLWPLCRQCCGVALDPGSARTRAWVAGRGLVVDVPTVTFPGAVYPVQRGTVVDVPGLARMLDRVIGRRLPRHARPLIVVTTPVLGGTGQRDAVRAAVRGLRPRGVLTVTGARAVALAAGADPGRPRLVLDIGAHLTEVVLLADGAVLDARRTALGTGDLDAAGTTCAGMAETTAAMVAAVLRQDRTGLALEALRSGVLLAGGGALRPELTSRLTGRLHAPLHIVPAPHTAAVRGAARLLEAAHAHPSATAASGGPHPHHPLPASVRRPPADREEEDDRPAPGRR